MPTLRTVIVFYRILGWLSLLGLVIGAIAAFWTDHFVGDISFLIWFLLAANLERGSERARGWGITIAVLSILVITSLIVMALTRGESAYLQFGSTTYGPDSVAFWAVSIGMIAILGFPAVLTLPRVGQELAARRLPRRKPPLTTNAIGIADGPDQWARRHGLTHGRSDVESRHAAAPAADRSC